MSIHKPVDPLDIKKHAMAWICVVVFSIVLYYDVFPSLFKDWMNDENYSHGVLVPFIIAYLYWVRRGRVKSLEYAPVAWGIGLFAAGLMLFLIGRFGSEFFTTRMSFLVLVSGAALALVGRSLFGLLLPGVVLFTLAIPLPYMLYSLVSFPLRLFASAVSSRILLGIGVPVFSEGNIIHLPAMTLSVEDACSGLRSLMSFITIGAVVIVLSTMSKARKGVFLASAFIVAIFTNILRIVVTGLLTTYYDKSLAEGFFHLFSGWAIFVSGLVMLSGVYFLLERGSK